MVSPKVYPSEQIARPQEFFCVQHWKRGSGLGTRLCLLCVCVCVWERERFLSSYQQQQKFEQMSDQIIGRLDEMGKRVDDLEKNINELMQQVDTREEPSPKK